MPPALPFQVVPFLNASGTESYRVTGTWKGERIRKNFTERANADALCNAKNGDALKARAAQPMWLVQTRLDERAIRAVEGAVDRIADRWPIREVIDAGISALEAAPDPQPVAPLVEEWLLIIESEVGARWFKDLRKAARRFAKGNPGLTTDRWDTAFTRAWLDASGWGKQTKANARNALHRFGRWLVERGFKVTNPAAGIVIRSGRSAAEMGDAPLPSIFTPAQAEALLWACQLGSCRRLLGWMATCLFTGLRPESEAPRATWAEINFRSGELSAMGRKRGAKPRIFKLQPPALAWLRLVKDDKMERPAVYSRRLRRRAVDLANERLTELHPSEKPILWDEDITRHTYASYRTPQIPVHKLAEEMGNKPSTIYAHYRHPKPAADVKAFWALLPAGATVPPGPAVPTAGG